MANISQKWPDNELSTKTRQLSKNLDMLLRTRTHIKSKVTNISQKWLDRMLSSKTRHLSRNIDILLLREKLCH